MKILKTIFCGSLFFFCRVVCIHTSLWIWVNRVEGKYLWKINLKNKKIAFALALCFSTMSFAAESESAVQKSGKVRCMSLIPEDRHYNRVFFGMSDGDCWVEPSNACDDGDSQYQKVIDHLKKLNNDDNHLTVVKCAFRYGFAFVLRTDNVLLAYKQESGGEKVVGKMHFFDVVDFTFFNASLAANNTETNQQSCNVLPLVSILMAKKNTVTKMMYLDGSFSLKFAHQEVVSVPGNGTQQQTKEVGIVYNNKSNLGISEECSNYNYEKPYDTIKNMEYFGTETDKGHVALGISGANNSQIVQFFQKKPYSHRETTKVLFEAQNGETLSAFVINPYNNNQLIVIKRNPELGNITVLVDHARGQELGRFVQQFQDMDFIAIRPYGTDIVLYNSAAERLVFLNENDVRIRTSLEAFTEDHPYIGFAIKTAGVVGPVALVGLAAYQLLKKPSRKKVQEAVGSFVTAAAALVSSNCN